MTTPSPPSETTAPFKPSASPSRTKTVVSPSAVTTSNAETAVARFPIWSPEPCVAVAQAPATEMCGREARLFKANPAASSGAASSP